jgi:PAS domain-containing protein/DNA-binding CsgD family transcriptional regulator
MIIKIRQLKNKQEVEQACALLYVEYIELLKWDFAPNNPSKIAVIVKNGKKILYDRITEYALWFGAFDGDKLVGCIRLFSEKEDIPLEIKKYPNAKNLVNKYLKPYCASELIFECSRVCINSNYKGLGLFLKLYLEVLEYVEQQNGTIFGTSSNGYVKSLFKQIDLPCLEYDAFKFEDTDTSMVNFYLVRSKNGELTKVIENLKYFIKNKNKKILDIFKVLEIVANMLPAPIYWHDKDGRVLGVNSLCLKDMNKSLLEVIGKTPYDLYTKEIADYVWGHSSRVIETGETLTQEEYAYNHKYQPIRSYLSTKAPLYDDFGHVIGVIGISIDITAQKELEHLRTKIKEHQLFKDCLDNMQKLLQNTQRKLINGNDLAPYKFSQSQMHLTKREKQILYYLSINQSPKDIATILGTKENKKLAPATIVSIINKKLYSKFEVYSVSKLIEKATMLNLISFLPESSE